MYTMRWLFGVLLLSALQCASALAIDGAYDTFDASNELDTRGITCVKGVHIVGVRGNSNRPPAPYGALQDAIEGLKQKIPNSNDFPVHYDKINTGADNSTQGTDRILQHIRNYTAKCPKTPIVLWGYSRGGIIIMDAICGLNTKYQENIIAVVTYGEESRVPNQPYNLGNCQNSGLYPRTDPKKCLPWTKQILSYCVYGDPDCCAGTPDEGKHLYYCPTFDTRAFAHVDKFYKEFRAKQKSGQESTIEAE